MIEVYIYIYNCNSNLIPEQKYSFCWLCIIQFVIYGLRVLILHRTTKRVLLFMLLETVIIFSFHCLMLEVDGR